MRVWATVHWLIIAGIIVVSLINASWIAPVQRGALDLIAAGSARGAAVTLGIGSSTARRACRDQIQCAPLHRGNP